MTHDEAAGILKISLHSDCTLEMRGRYLLQLLKYVEQQKELDDLPIKVMIPGDTRSLVIARLMNVRDVPPFVASYPTAFWNMDK